METSTYAVVPSQCSMRKKKDIQIRMEKPKLFAEDMLITEEIPNEPTKSP